MPKDLTKGESARNERRFLFTVYTEGKSANRIIDEYERDRGMLSSDELREKYADGMDRGHISSIHLRSPLYVDQYNNEYTPVDEPRSDAFYIRVPKSKARKLHGAVADETIGAVDILEPGMIVYPVIGTELHLRRTHDKTAPETIVHVLACNDQMQGSATVYFAERIDSTQTSSQSAHFEKIAQKNAARIRDLTNGV